MIASNEVYIDGSCIGRYVVNLYGNLVVGYEPLMCERSFTEWICEPIKIYLDSTGSLRVDLHEY